MRGCRFTQEDLPIPRDLHKIFVRLYIRRVIGWLGDQAAAFSLCSVDLLPAMCTAWDKTFLDHPHDILTRGAVYYIVSAQYVSNEETDLLCLTLDAAEDIRMAQCHRTPGNQLSCGVLQNKN